MNFKKFFMGLCVAAVAGTGCSGCENDGKKSEQMEFPWVVDRFGDTEILRYQVPGFEELSLQEKKLIYYLGQAALWGRDILFDQHYRHNLAVRHTLEAIYSSYPGNRDTDDFRALEEYLKKVWFSSGVHHHYSMDKFVPGFSREAFEGFVRETPADSFPAALGGPDAVLTRLAPVLFDPEFDSKRVSLDRSADVVTQSASNFYEGVTEQEVEDFYREKAATDDSRPLSHGLNTKVVKRNGEVVEIVWKEGGMYDAAIRKITRSLEQAAEVASNPLQKEVIERLIDYYRSGDLALFDAFNILWVQDQESSIDFINGFTEVYGDPLGRKGTWEAIVNFRNDEKTKRSSLLSQNAQWFENHSPIDDAFKKKEVKGVTAKVINIAILGGDCYPSSPIGINLPNADWIRKEHGSKSVTLDNIMYAHSEASLLKNSSGEFIYSDEELARARKWGAEARSLFVDMHECLGHGSGQMNPGVLAEHLRSYHSTIEEARADLFALYFLMDPRLQELGLVPDRDMAVASYESEIRGGMMTQLVRVEYGKDVEESHMRNRKLIAEWCYEKGAADKVIERRERDGKTFFVVNDPDKLRELFGALLREVQRIKSEGDFEAARDLVETYGVRVNPVLHREVLDRFEALDVASYSGFVNPVYEPVVRDGEITDIRILYTQGYAEQMMEYSRNYSTLAIDN